MGGYYQYCNCCGREFNNTPGAWAYLEHLGRSTYYAVPLSPEATFWLGAKAREYLGMYSSLFTWIEAYYKDWKPIGPDVIPIAYGWFSFRGIPKSSEYQVWRKEHGLA